MEFKDFLNICKTYFMSDITISEFMMNFFGDLASVEDKCTVNSACPFQKETNSRKATQVFYGERPMSKADASFMKAHFHEENLIEMVNKLDECVQQNLVDELSPHIKEVNLLNLPEKMCSLFRDFMDEMSGKKRESSNLKENLDLSNDEKKKGKDSKEIFDSNTISSARKFSIDHEEEKELFILCQIAEYINPFHKHVRPLYTEYLEQNDDVRKAIMFLNGIPILKFEPNWEYLYLEKFRNDIKELKLVTDMDLLYDGGKYFHCSRHYADKKLKNKNPRIFPVVPTQTRQRIYKDPYKGDLLNYIDEYLYYKDDKDMFKYVSIPPFDWMIKHLDLMACPEEKLAFWMCKFIWSVCHIIPREIPSRKKVMKDEDDIYVLEPTMDDIIYMEDLYYLTLFVMYNIYSQ